MNGSEITLCPDWARLQQLLSGQTSDPEFSKLEAHLLQCDKCSREADALIPSGEVTAMLSRAETQVFRTREAEQVEQLIRKVRTLRSATSANVEQTWIGAGEVGADCTPQETLLNAGQTVAVDASTVSFLRPAQQPDEIGRLGGYRILQVLGSGGMGVVYRAEDPSLKRLVALKVMKPTVAATGSAKERFLREAQFTAAIEHDHIVQIYQVGEDYGVPFIAMPLLRGESLKCRLGRTGQMPQSDVVRIGKEVSAGLAAAHERGLIHRDIKPDNIWIEEKTGRVKILDFGLVRSVSDDTELTQSGMVLGTPKYMAPEQAQGHVVDHRSDLFSLGSVLYHLATGKPAFDGNNLTATLMAVVHQEPQPIEALSPDIHPQLATLIAELVQKDRDKRPQSASLVSQRLADIEQAMKNPSTGTAGGLETLSNGSRTPIESVVSTNIAELTIVPQPVVRRTPPRPPRSNRLMLAAGAGGLLLMLGILIITIRDKDGKETTVRVTSGVVADIDVQPGSKVSIREEANGASDAGDTAGMKSASVANKDLQTSIGNSVSMEASLNKPKLWSVGPLPAWASEEPRWSIMKESFTIPGVVERPAEFKEIGRWNVDTVQSRGAINVARFSPDGKWLATGSTDGHVRIYDVTTMKLRQLLPGLGGQQGAIDLSWHPDSQRIAVAADNAFQLRIWTIDGQLLREELAGSDTYSTMNSVAWTCDGSRLICGGANRLDVRDSDGAQIKALVSGQDGPHCNFGSIAVSPDRQRFIVWQFDGARIWNAETFELEATIPIQCSNGAGGHRVRWSSKDRISLSTFEQLTICNADGTVLKKFPAEPLCATAWHPDGETLTIWRLDPYNLNTTTGESTPADQRTFIAAGVGTVPTAMEWSPDGKRIVLAGGRLVVCKDGITQVGHDSGVTGMPISSISLRSDGRQIASVCNISDDCVRLWSSDGMALSPMPLNELLAAGPRVAWSPNGRYVAVAWYQSNHFFIGRLGGEFLQVAGNCVNFAWNPEGAQLAAGLGNGHVLITDTEGKLLHDLDTGEAGGVAVGWSKQGTLVAHVGQKILRVDPTSSESTISLLTDAPEGPSGHIAVWRPDGQEIWMCHDIHVNVTDGVKDRIRRATSAVAWAPDGSKYLFPMGPYTALLRPDGSQLLSRTTNASTTTFNGAWSPSGDTVFVGYDQSLLVARDAEDLHVKWTGVLLPNQKSVTFDVGGSVLDGDRETLEREFVYYAADENGNVRLLSASEFEIQTGEEILPLPGRYFDSEYRFAISTGDDWHSASSEAFTVPGIARASYSRPGGVSLNLFIQETGAYVDPSWLVNESAKAQEEKLSATVLEKDVRQFAGRDAMWMIVEGQGNGSAIDGKGPVKTTQHWLAIPREKDVVVALLTSPSGTFAGNQALFLKAIETLQLKK